MYIEPTFSYVNGIFLTNWTSVTLRCPAPHDDITASAGVRLHSSHLIVLTSPYLLATPLHSSWLAGSTHLCSLIGDFLPSGQPSNFPALSPELHSAANRHKHNLCCLHVLILLQLTIVQSIHRVLDEHQCRLSILHTKCIVCIFDCSI